MLEPLHVTESQRDHVLDRFGVDLWRKKISPLWLAWVSPVLAAGLIWESIPGSPIGGAAVFAIVLWGISIFLLATVSCLALCYVGLKKSDPYWYAHIVLRFALRRPANQWTALQLVALATIVVTSAAAGRAGLSFCVFLSVAMFAAFLLHERRLARRLLSEIPSEDVVRGH